MVSDKTLIKCEQLILATSRENPPNFTLREMIEAEVAEIHAAFERMKGIVEPLESDGDEWADCDQLVADVDALAFHFECGLEDVRFCLDRLEKTRARALPPHVNREIGD